MKTFMITEIIGWHEDSWKIRGAASHEGCESVRNILDKEYCQKNLDNFEKNYRGVLPFVCTAENIDEAIDKLNARHFDYDLLKVQDVDYKIITNENYV